MTAQERGDLGRRGIGRRAREKSRSPVAELRSSYPVDRDGSSRGVEEPPCGAGCVIGGAGWRPGWWRSACAGQGVCFEVRALWPGAEERFLPPRAQCSGGDLSCEPGARVDPFAAPAAAPAVVHVERGVGDGFGPVPPEEGVADGPVLPRVTPGDGVVAQPACADDSGRAPVGD